MRAYRREHDHAQIGKYDRPVGAVRAERRTVGDNVEVEHPAERALDDHDVVERAEMLAACARGALALDDRLERDAPVDLVVSGHDAGEYGFGLVSRCFGEKAPATQVDSEDWRFALADEPRDARPGSVAAESEEQVG